MSHPLAQLRPQPVWQHFAEIAAIPRPSKHEERIVAWVRGLAASHGWDVRSDEVGNLVLVVPATAGREDAPVVVLQSHLDMVCEKNGDVTHDFMQDPIRTRVEGDWVRASGTTLGADNGIGVAAALAAATDPGVSHGPLELLFTIDEETGLTGAQQLDGRIVRGRTLLNLDSEEDGTIFVGCAGGADCHLSFEPRRETPAAGTGPWRVGVRGLKGGHSGLNIHENRANALKLLVRLLIAARAAGIAFQLGELLGGSKHNAIPREADATVLVAANDVESMRGIIRGMLDDYRIEFEHIDDELQISFDAESRPPVEVLAGHDRDRLLDLLAVLPHGVLAMSPDVPGLVETSSNLAVVERDGDAVRIVTSSRSSINSAMESVTQAIGAAGRLARVETRISDGYPGWKPNLDSPALRVVRRVYAGLWGREPEITAVHAGLECGLLGEKVPGLDMVSFGPEIRGAHSPDERVQVSSVERFWEALVQVLDTLSGGPTVTADRRGG